MKLSRGRSPSQSAGILSKLLLLVGLVLVVGAIAWVLWLPALVVAQIHSRTGFTATVDQLSVNPFSGKVTVKGFMMKNPVGWPVLDFVDLRNFRAEADLGSLISNRIVMNEVVIDIARCTTVKNQQGQLNTTAFSHALSGGSASSDPAKSKGAKKEFLIKHLVLKFDTLVYDDHSGSKPVVKEYHLNINRELRDVDSVAKLVNPIASASISVITDVFSGTANGRTDLLKDASGAIQAAGKKTGEKLKSLLDSLDKKKP